MEKKLFDQLKESLDQAIEHAKGERDDLRTTVCFDNAHFVLNDEQWLEFNKKLGTPPRDLPERRQLLNDITVLE